MIVHPESKSKNLSMFLVYVIWKLSESSSSNNAAQTMLRELAGETCGEHMKLVLKTNK